MGEEKYKQLKIKIKSLFWDMCHQPEKTSSNLTIIINELFDQHTDEQKDQIKKEIIDNLKKS